MRKVHKGPRTRHFRAKAHTGEKVALISARAEMGARQQGLDALQLRLDEEDVELQTVLSLQRDVDIVEVMSVLTARQVALQAGLQSTARIFSLSLLDYL